MAARLRRVRRRSAALAIRPTGIGHNALYLALSLTLFVAVFAHPLPAPAERRLSIAPMEADLQAMRRTLKRVEQIVQERAPEKIRPLLSPSLTPERHQAAADAVAFRVKTLPPEVTYYLRSDVGMGAVVPFAPDRVRLQVVATVDHGEGQLQSENVRFELEAVESQSRRQWLIRSISFSERHRGPPMERPSRWPWVVAAAAAALAVAVAGGLLWRRRKKRLG